MNLIFLGLLEGKGDLKKLCGTNKNNIFTKK